jgi:hypothetical protein
MASYLENQFWRDFSYYYPGIPLEREYRFSSDPRLKATGRKFRFDFAHPIARVAIEIQGGIYSGKPSGHTSVKGIERDCEKFCLAAANGWLVFPIAPRQIGLPICNVIAETIQTLSVVPILSQP